MSLYTAQTKFKRCLTILDIVERWGPLEKGDLKGHLTHKFDISDQTGLDKPLSQDLQTLRNENEIHFIPYNKFGEEIDSDNQRATYYKYQKIDSYSRISGEKELNALGGGIYAPESAENFIRIVKGKHRESFNNFAFYFEAKNELYHLEINLKNLALAPAQRFFHIIVTGNKDIKSKHIQRVLEQYSPYCALLVLDDPFLSSPKRNYDGHLRISFQAHDSKILQDLGARNETFVRSLSDTEYSQMLSGLTFHNDKTKTRHWVEEINEPMHLLDKERGTRFKKAPILIKVVDSGYIFS